MDQFLQLAKLGEAVGIDPEGDGGVVFDSHHAPLEQ